jgi:hypothetical protein
MKTLHNSTITLLHVWYELNETLGVYSLQIFYDTRYLYTETMPTQLQSTHTGTVLTTCNGLGNQLVGITIPTRKIFT